MTRLPYETSGGNLSESITFEQLIEYLRKVEEDLRYLGRLAKLDHDDVIGNMWILTADRLHRCQQAVSSLGNSRTRSSTGYHKKSGGSHGPH